MPQRSISPRIFGCFRGAFIRRGQPNVERRADHVIVMDRIPHRFSGIGVLTRRKRSQKTPIDDNKTMQSGVYCNLGKAEEIVGIHAGAGEPSRSHFSLAGR